jgi:tetratricopeptide (TPR) repeat protein
MPAVDAATADALVAIAEDARARLRRNDAGATTAFEERYSDMLEALDWYLAEGRPDPAFRLASSLVPFWITTKRIDEGDRWFARALAAGDGSNERIARAIYDHGYLVFWAGLYDVADGRFRDARERARLVDDPTLAALALAGLARVALNADVPKAIGLLREGLAVTEGTADREGRSSALHVLGVALQMSGDLVGARDIMSARLDLGRDTGDEFIVWVESANLSMVERQLGNLDRAETLSREAVSIAARREDAMGIPWSLNGLAAVTAAKGDLERAATLLGLADVLLDQAGGEWPPDERQQYEGTRAAISEGLPGDVQDRARSRGATMNATEGIAYALAARA